MVHVSSFRIAAAVFLSIMWSGAVVFAEDSELNRQTMKGLQGVYVSVEVPQTKIHKYMQKVGLSKEQLQSVVEDRLKENGIQALSRDQWQKAAGKPVLYVRVNTRETVKYWYDYDVKVELQQVVFMEANPKTKIHATTWAINQTGNENIGNLHIIKTNVLALVGRFIEAYKAVG